MQRKTFSYELLDGKEYTFSERNREDVNFLHYQNLIRASRIKFISDNVQDDMDRFALLRLEMDKVYSDVEVGIYIMSNPEEVAKLVYASFKIANPGISFEDFKKLVDEKMIKELNELISELERPEEIFDEMITSELGVTQKKLAEWAKEQPALYKWLKKAGNIAIKKKEAGSQTK
jgi:hypothetical protein